MIADDNGGGTGAAEGVTGAPQATHREFIAALHRGGDGQVLVEGEGHVLEVDALEGRARHHLQAASQ